MGACAAEQAGRRPVFHRREALIKDSVKGMLLRSSHELVIPEYAIEETKKHLDLVARRSRPAEKEINSIIDALLAKVEVVPADKVASKMNDAEAAMSLIDEGDASSVAACMSADCEGIWSDDRELKRQHDVRVWNTKEISELSSA